MTGTGYVLGVDFGTTHTVAAVCDRVGSRVLVLEGGESLLPSCVLADHTGALIAGRAAQRSAGYQPEMFLAHPKRHIDEDTYMFDHAEVPITEVIAAVLGKVTQEARRQYNGSAPDRVVLTHPAGWAGRRIDVLRQAARSAGLGEVDLVAEPVAAAVHHLSSGNTPLEPGQAVAVYDLGGGTFDAAVVVAEPLTSPEARSDGGLQIGTMMLRVASDGGDDDIGGVHFDNAILMRLRQRHYEQAPEVWDGIMAPVSRQDRNNRRQLLEDIRGAKEGLTESRQQFIALPGHATDAVLTQSELNELIAPAVERTARTLTATLERARPRPAGLTATYTVGGSSRIPLVHATLLRYFDKPPVTLGQPEQVVAMGAAAAAATTPAPEVPKPPPPPWPQPEEQHGRRPDHEVHHPPPLATAPSPAPAGWLMALAAALAVVSPFLPYFDAGSETTLTGWGSLSDSSNGHGPLFGLVATLSAVGLLVAAVLFLLQRPSSAALTVGVASASMLATTGAYVALELEALGVRPELGAWMLWLAGGLGLAATGWVVAAHQRSVSVRRADWLRPWWISLAACMIVLAVVAPFLPLFTLLRDSSSPLELDGWGHVSNGPGTGRHFVLVGLLLLPAVGMLATAAIWAVTSTVRSVWWWSCALAGTASVAAVAANLAVDAEGQFDFPDAMDLGFYAFGLLGALGVLGLVVAAQFVSTARVPSAAKKPSDDMRRPW